MIAEVKIDIDKATRMLNNYMKSVEAELEKTLDKTAREVETNQKKTLIVNEKNPSGNLFNSIHIKSEENSRIIGPNLTIAPYAPYVEEGTRYFEGYHFVRDSLDGVQLRFFNDIERALKNE